ncbi:branched-chain amino acid aminotransferase [Coccidioides immitis RS]|uniref:Branched-chain amino acid aminotransferase n=5 Tax=Coccidioides TaxID=5500 RepID=J3K0E2_COCIM|nr:branched-chain amino acid aminotransferase [Coccidioides immitis RS]XP_003071948.1 aminotransferase, class IV family protein [Coccidioides posadasii C735 delta SOWgp]KMM71139.1 branched-chain-amino-acid aminotransferase 5 [Coccidioides posadasii RMSCC 3488]KMP09271.1 branched-chain-amino-acid aminotransferase 5 [Coccidioides immitis RMSCC 2394]KMU91888.1 branched-chain-amino-acid aminotransferase 5 [Coccidioides immitis H538.4]EAS27308.3 branched-chain amino acid aminotransferase [Coccidioi|eukprot:XP_003071948.1 aminotransferase, class IV family protein [Coccidioides posadasii C735 delta SOWgp]
MASSASFPPPPVSSIDWNNIGFKVWEVNGHVESRFSHSSSPQWSPPQFVASPYLPIHGMAPGLNYGQQAYEGMKAFRHAPTESHPNGRITIFRPHRNAERMQHSARFISIPPVPESHFLECVKLAVSANAGFVPPHSTGAAMYIRPLIFGSSAQLGLSPPDEYTFVVFVMPTGVYHGVHAVNALILEDFDRSAPDGTGSAKVGGNYAPVLRHSEKARADGYGITLHLDSKTRSEIDEFSTSAFIGVLKDASGHVTLVIPDSKNAIDSVTASSIMAIGSNMFGYKVEKRRVPYDELKEFSEVMAAGTAAALVPIKSITMKSRNDVFNYEAGEGDSGGEVYKKLIHALKGIQRGEIHDKMGWLVDIEPVPAGWVEASRGKEADVSIANLP